MGVIEIRDLQVMAIVGLLPEEREREQPLSIDIDLHRDIAQAAESDNLVFSTDYAEVLDFVVDLVRVGNFFLLETLAERLSAVILDFDQYLTAVTVVVRKLRPPVPHVVNTIGVRAHRVR